MLVNRLMGWDHARKGKTFKELLENVKTESRLVIDMKVKVDGIEAKVTLGEDEKIYFFPFITASDQSNRISLFISSLPLKFYIDAFLEQIKKKELLRPMRVIYS